MSLRSIIVAAALVLILAVAPAAVNLAPLEAQAAETDTATAAKAVLSDKTPASDLDKKILRQHIKALRAAIKARSLAGDDLRQARQRIKAYSAEMKARRGGQGGSPDKTAPATKSGGEQAPAATGGTEEAPKSGAAPKAGGEEQPSGAVSESDCNDRWNKANKNGDETLTGEEAAPFAEALKSAGTAPAGSDLGTVKRPDFMAACTKGAFKDLK
jgi:hypothetical protein